jgi:hypothetical protein
MDSWFFEMLGAYINNFKVNNRIFNHEYFTSSEAGLMVKDHSHALYRHILSRNLDSHRLPL